jgi:3-deoxy-D-manno-octulosonic-acid transferase
MVRELRRREPEATLIVSAMTRSGIAMAESKLSDTVDGTTYLPYDLPGATLRAMQAIQPDLLVLEYTELWPNLIHAARSRGARVALTNGRFHERKMRSYRWLFKLAGNPLRALDAMLMRSEVEAERAIALGASKEQVSVTGNTKFDLVARPSGTEKLEELRMAFSVGSEPVLVAGSTHDGEEEAVLAIFRRLRSDVPSLRLLIAPRYPERASRIVALARQFGFDSALRTRSTRDAPASAQVPVLILDTIGELLDAYGLATVVFVGGSFVPRGGQNILEPAGQGKPVLYGPNMANFVDSIEVLQGRGGIQLGSYDELESVLRSLLARPEECERLGQIARESVRKVSGATQLNVEALLRLARGAAQSPCDR